jgi:hypothetical protein
VHEVGQHAEGGDQSYDLPEAPKGEEGSDDHLESGIEDARLLGEGCDKGF